MWHHISDSFLVYKTKKLHLGLSEVKLSHDTTKDTDCHSHMALTLHLHEHLLCYT